MRAVLSGVTGSFYRICLLVESEARGIWTQPRRTYLLSQSQAVTRSHDPGDWSGLTQGKVRHREMEQHLEVPYRAAREGRWGEKEGNVRVGG